MTGLVAVSGRWRCPAIFVYVILYIRREVESRQDELGQARTRCSYGCFRG